MAQQTPALLVAGPILGWRLWVVDRQERQLRSLTSGGDPWPRGRHSVAQCRYDEHDDATIPVSGCTCGVYALRRMESLSTLPAPWPPGWMILVAGQVALWGKVIEHTEGWRAEFAYPAALSLWLPSLPLDLPHPPWLFQLLRDLGERYGCPLFACPTLNLTMADA